MEKPNIFEPMRWIFALAFAIIFVQISFLPTMGYSFQTGSHSRLNYTIGIETPSREPAVVVTRMPYSLKYEALFQSRAKQIGETIKSNVIGRATSTNILTSVQTNTQAALPNRGLLITSLSNAVILPDNMTALNFSNKMAEQTRNITVPSNMTSTFNVTIPVDISALK
jgi:hypothetical protein